MPDPSLAAVLLAFALAGAAAINDWRAGAIPNRFTIPGLAIAPLLHAWAARGLRPPFGLSAPLFAAAASVVSGGLCALVPLLLFRFRLAGGGDAKLLAALGALLLPRAGLAVELLTFVFAAFFIPARLAYRGRLFATLGQTIATAANPALPADRRRHLPNEMVDRIRLGPFILLGTFTAHFLSRMTP
jgi:Flp pilus assembly protein protease CpaA